MIRAKKFWKKKINLIHWNKAPKNILEQNNESKFCWFKDGKLNLFENCILQNLKKNPNKTAIICYDKNKIENKYTYSEINLAVNNFCRLLLKYKLKKNDVIAIHASASIESAVSMLACSKLGITFSVIFEDLPLESILKRIEILNSKLFVTRDNTKNFYNLAKSIKKFNKKIRIINFSKNKNLVKKKNIIFSNTDDILSDKKNYKDEKIKYFRSNKPLFVLFTSGSTGDPKGIIHSTGGYLLYAKYTCINQFGMNKNSIVLTASDAGWINGHTYSLFGPLSIGSTTILLEKPISIIDKFFLKSIINNNQISILYLPVTLIRVLKSIVGKDKLFLKNKISALGSMGEPLAKNVAKWFSSTFKKNKLSIVNTYFQTETGGIISSPRYNSQPPNNYHGTVGKPVCENLKIILKNNQLVISTPWPGCLIGVKNGKSYFNKYWDKENNFKMFDIGKFNKNKILEVYGRSDDVINVRGHRVGSGEVEEKILKLNDIKETCVVAVEDKLEGNRLVVFFSKSKYGNNEHIKNKINSNLINYFGTYILPKYIIELTNLPKTKSGKILRRILGILINDYKTKKIGDTSTILDKNILKEIKYKIEETINE